MKMKSKAEFDFKALVVDYWGNFRDNTPIMENHMENWNIKWKLDSYG